jgi:serine/threonine-protein kinase
LRPGISTGLIGAILDEKYRIVRRLGEGGMGSVYEGENLRVGRRVAIKVIAPELAQNAEVAGRFRREAKVASSIANEHIVRIYDVDADPKHGLYLVMELLRGEDLARRLKRERDMSVEAACTIAYHVALGLDAVHTAHVIHRDLKPANVFLHEVADGTTIAKLVDFGISKTIAQPDAPGETALTRVGTVVGTLQYMSPEQARGVTLDGRTDLWSLGCLLYELLAGRPAYPIARTLEDAYKQLMVGKPPRLAEIAKWVPPEIVALVEDCMQPELDKRIPDAFTFAQRLARMLPEVDLAGSIFKPEAPPSLPPIEGDETQVSSNAELEEIRKSSLRRPEPTAPALAPRAKVREPKPASASAMGAVREPFGPRPTKGAKKAAQPLALVEEDDDLAVTKPRASSRAGALPADHVARSSTAKGVPAPAIAPATASQAPPHAEEETDAEEERSLVARASDIRELRRQLIAQERQELGLPAPPSKAPGGRRIRWPLLALAIVLAVALIGVIVIIATR